jgi:hypothetical protein
MASTTNDVDVAPELIEYDFAYTYLGFNKAVRLLTGRDEDAVLAFLDLLWRNLNEATRTFCKSGTLDDLMAECVAKGVPDHYTQIFSREFITAPQNSPTIPDIDTDTHKDTK